MFTVAQKDVPPDLIEYFEPADCGRCYVCSMVQVFREVRRVLRDDGTVWLNLGDSYASSGERANGGNGGLRDVMCARGANGAMVPAGGVKREGLRGQRFGSGLAGLKPKDLCGIPWRVAFALQADGWYLRSDIIWAKCLSGGAIVYAKTQKGEMPMTIKDMARLDPATVQLWDGVRWNQVVGWKETTGDVERKKKSQRRRQAKYRLGVDVPVDGDIEVELRNGERIGSTSTHRWPTRRGLVESADIRIGDVIEATTLPEPDRPKYPSGLGDQCIGWFVGLYIAEGSRDSTGTIQIAGHIKETERLDRLRHLAAVYDGTCAIYPSSTGKGASIALNGKVLSAIIDTYVSGQRAQGKHLSTLAWQRSNDFLRAVMDGYLSGDGHLRENGRWILAFCKNDQLASDLRVMAARLGASLRLRRCQHTMRGRKFPGWRGSLYFDPSQRHRPDSEVVAIRQSRARRFWDIAVESEPHVFALASGVLTHNSNPMPESVTDRPTKAHEYIFLLSKSASYFYDADAIKEDNSLDMQRRSALGHTRGANGKVDASRQDALTLRGPQSMAILADGRNKRSVWHVATQPYPEAHFATFPEKLIEPCILAGTSEKGCCPACLAPWVRVVESERGFTDGKCNGCGRSESQHVVSEKSVMGGANVLDGSSPSRARNANGAVPCGANKTLGWEPSCDCHAGDPIPCTVLDPFTGSGTTGAVAVRHQRNFVGVELNPSYVELARKRIGAVAPLFAEEKTA